LYLDFSNRKEKYENEITLFTVNQNEDKQKKLTDIFKFLKTYI